MPTGSQPRDAGLNEIVPDADMEGEFDPESAMPGDDGAAVDGEGALSKAPREEDAESSDEKDDDVDGDVGEAPEADAMDEDGDDLNEGDGDDAGDGADDQDEEEGEDKDDKGEEKDDKGEEGAGDEVEDEAGHGDHFVP